MIDEMEIENQFQFKEAREIARQVAQSWSSARVHAQNEGLKLRKPLVSFAF